ncbi:MAG: acetylxylan esterase, partial [Verrucomicrobiae bacterium]
MNRTNLVLSTAAALLIASSSFCALAADPAKEDTVKIQVTPDRKEALYQCGEKVKFQGAVTKNGKPLTTGKATVRITNDGRKIISTQEMDLSKNNPFEIEGTMAVPGFLRCEVTLDKDKGCAGAGFEPEKIQPAPNLPEDFNKFWSDGVRELDQIPPDVKLEPLPEFSTPEFDCFKVSFANIDNTRIYGFLSVPKGK